MSTTWLEKRRVQISCLSVHVYTYMSKWECFEDKVNENKTENVKESLEPVNVDKAGSEASEEGTHGLSKVFALLGYNKVP